MLIGGGPVNAAVRCYPVRLMVCCCHGNPSLDPGVLYNAVGCALCLLRSLDAGKLVTRIWIPGAIGLAAACLTLTISSRLPAPIRVVQLPALAAAIASCIAVRKKQWKTVLNAELKASLAQTIAILLCVVLGFFVGLNSTVGKPVLIALNQDVVGVLRSEQREIAIIGALFLAGVFGIVGVILASALPITAGRAANNLREPERRITQNSKSTSTAAARLRWPFPDLN